MKLLGNAVALLGPSPETCAKDQQDASSVTETSFPPHENLVRHIVNDDAAQGRDESAWLSDNDFVRADKSAKNVHSNYIKALIIHISAEVASQRSGPPLGRLYKEVVMLVPTTWPHSLKSMILQVGFSLLLLFSWDTIWLSGTH